MALYGLPTTSWILRSHHSHLGLVDPVFWDEERKILIEMPAEIVLSGHGEPITDHATLIDDRIAKHDRRKEKSYSLIAEQPRSGYELAQAIWGNVAVTQAFLTLSR